MERLATTPFGGGRVSARVLARQAYLNERQERLREGEGGNASGRADKWQLLRALTEARVHFGLGDRTICLLEAMVSFFTERELDGSQPIIVFPSNNELSLRARGMAPATIRRHIAALVQAGMIFRRDSANGKRYCRKDDRGQVEDAFGFDLAPLALRADEIYAAAEEVRVQARASRAARAEITILNRDISKIIELALDEGRPGKWMDFSLEQRSVNGQAKTDRSAEALQRLVEELRLLRQAVENAYLAQMSDEELSANDAHNERHYQNSKTDQTFESSGNEKNNAGQPIVSSRKLAVSLSMVKKLCPQIADYASQGIGTWTDFISAADVVRAVLGISPDAWLKAKAAMGEQAAAITIAAMLEKAESIRSAGGYLRSLTEKAAKNQFSIYPMLQALDKSKASPRPKPN
ncbi:plasmid replication protein RepC [Rhizobium paknamense]|uniref:Replication initiation protein RepC n=1 Tax=Rhizobium paknamense TaxID=1206817 RepID=A0ABU0IGG2_9HYPH|nr:plasmid replication protein RepC [Rhizobium paknamense]MDQ0456500.1 replication initiation protein RepC [Rhizobium paknamense]